MHLASNVVGGVERRQGLLGFAVGVSHMRHPHQPVLLDRV
jgi:hypothetical protein